jgi:hypothetical protein
MNRDDIIRMAVDAGASGCANPDKWGILEISYESLERFAALIAAHEREECAKVCEDSVEYAADELARQIRARGEK